MKNIVYILVAVAAIAAITLYSQYGGLPGVAPSDEVKEPGKPLAQPQPAKEPIRRSLVRVAQWQLRALGDATEQGSAILSQANGKAVVTINLSGTPAGVKQPAHLHIGTCPGLGPILYNLDPVVDGFSETVLQEPVEKLKSQLPLVINIHKSEAESTVYVSCGEVEL